MHRNTEDVKATGERDFEPIVLLPLRLRAGFLDAVAAAIERRGYACEQVGDETTARLGVFFPSFRSYLPRVALLHDDQEYWYAEAFGFRPKVADGLTFKIDVPTDPSSIAFPGLWLPDFAKTYAEYLAERFVSKVVRQLVSRRERGRRRRRR